MPKINSFYFGNIIIDGKKFTNDVVITANGTVREKHRSHTIEKEDIQEFIIDNVETIVIGTGTAGNVKVDPNVNIMAQLSGINVIIKPTINAVEEFNKIKGKKAGIFHLTC